MKNKKLIINFGKSNDIISSSHLIGSMMNNNPNSEIHILTYKENTEVLSIIAGVSKVHTIDRELIKNISSNALYSDAFAVNAFMLDIHEAIRTQWDEVINYNNDSISTLISSQFQANKITTHGTTLSSRGVARTSSPWSNYQNNVASSLNRQVINKTQLRNFVANEAMNYDCEKIKINEDYALIASQNFSKIRQSKKSPDALIIGISLCEGYDGHILGLDTLENIIETLEDSERFKAVLILSGQTYQKDIANSLNQKFNDRLISVNVDTIATSSVVSNLDYFISPANDHLAIADAVETKVVEIRCRKSKQPSIVTTDGSHTIYQGEECISDEITLILNEEYDSHMPVDRLETPTPIYRCVHDQTGIMNTQIRGEIDIQKELRYHVERSVFFQIINGTDNTELLKHIKSVTAKDDILTYTNQVKDELTSSVKILLATIRSLKGVTSSKKNLQQFINYLDTLINLGRDETTVGSIIRFFEGEIENIEAKSSEENMEIIEEKLFSLKGYLQTLTNVITQFINIDSEETKRETDQEEKHTDV